MRRRATAAGLTLAAVVAAAGCGEGALEPSTDLSGSYELTSLTFEGQPTLSPPFAVGTLVLTSTTYDVDVTIAIPGQPQQRIEDSGTYATAGSTWTQESSVTGSQAVGTFSLSGDVLTVTTTIAGMGVTAVWRRTG